MVESSRPVGMGQLSCFSYEEEARARCRPIAVEVVRADRKLRQNTGHTTCGHRQNN